MADYVLACLGIYCFFWCQSVSQYEAFLLQRPLRKKVSQNFSCVPLQAENILPVSILILSEARLLLLFQANNQL